MARDPSLMSVAELKRELHDNYKVSDFSDCLEKGDLEKKLAEARKAPPNTESYFGGVARVGNVASPTALVVFCHGFGDTHQGWADGMEPLIKAVPHAMFVLPTAPTQPVTMNGGMRMTAWYDIKTIGVGPEDDEGIVKSAHALRAFAKSVCEGKKIPLDRVVFAGFSQGGCVSIAAGLITGRKSDDAATISCAGVCALSGYFGGRATVPRLAAATSPPIAMFHGEADPLIPVAMCHASKVGIETMVPGAKDQIRLKTYPGLAHSANIRELADVAAFLKEVLPK